MIRNLKTWVESFGRMLRKDTRRMPLLEAMSKAKE